MSPRFPAAIDAALSIPAITPNATLAGVTRPAIGVAAVPIAPILNAAAAADAAIAASVPARGVRPLFAAAPSAAVGPSCLFRAPIPPAAAAPPAAIPPSSLAILPPTNTSRRRRIIFTKEARGPSRNRISGVKTTIEAMMLARAGCESCKAEKPSSSFVPKSSIASPIGASAWAKSLKPLPSAFRNPRTRGVCSRM